jgi:hypothetical protein
MRVGADAVRDRAHAGAMRRPFLPVAERPSPDGTPLRPSRGTSGPGRCRLSGVGGCPGPPGIARPLRVRRAIGARPAGKAAEMGSRRERAEGRHRIRQLLRRVWVGLVVAAVVKELRTPSEARTWLGVVAGFVPYDFRVPTVARLRERVWAPEDDHLLNPTAVRRGVDAQRRQGCLAGSAAGRGGLSRRRPHTSLRSCGRVDHVSGTRHGRMSRGRRVAGVA